MEMTIDELKCIIGEYKLRIPPTVYYELLTDLENAEFITKDQYEARLKADIKAILVELQLEIEEIEIDLPFGFEPVSKTAAFYEGVSASSRLIQQKINSLKENTDGNK